MIDVIRPVLTWRGTLIPLSITEVKYIILHHTATATESVEQVHQSHLKLGWAGIGYNEYIRKDGTVYIGRGDHVGAHTSNFNSMSYGICAEGNFQLESMSDVQKEAILDRVRFQYRRLNKPNIVGHRELLATACPGSNYPLEEIKVQGRQELIGSILVPDKSNSSPVSTEVNVVIPATVRKGSKGDAVRQLQQQLNSRGFDCGTVDSDFGPKTGAAVRAFQQTVGINVDGIVGPITWRALLTSPSPQKQSPVIVIPATVNRGSKGSVVKQLQEELNKRGYKLVVDGDFGPKTESAVKDFQAKNKLSVDGIVGPLTWGALLS